MSAPKNQSVKVALRVRPLNKRQTELNSPLCVQTKDNIIGIKKGNDVKQFVFDYVYGIQSKQTSVYQTCGYSLVQNALEGFNGTIFAYGQTGAGKTFTMVGDYKDPQWKGIIPRGFDHVIEAIQISQNRKYIVRASFIEIYNEDIFDLLDMKGDVKKDLKQSPQAGVFIKDLKLIPVKSVDEMFKLLDFGNKNRSVAKTSMNATSSRSHALFTVHIESMEEEKVKGSKLNFVDLAGSQRQGKTGATGDTLKQGAKINLSLTALGNVINALVDGKKGGHIPYRDSKLTRMLQDSLGGNTKTLMIASVSPALDNFQQTVSTLRYAARARNIKNTPKINQDPKDALIKQYLAEIQLLKKQLGSGGSMGTINPTSSNTQIPQSYEQISREMQKIKEKEKQFNKKQAQLFEMKMRMKEMQQLIMKKSNQTPEMQQKIKKHKAQKKKIQKIQQDNKKNVQKIQNQQIKQLQFNQLNQFNDGKKQDINYWKNMAKNLKLRLKNVLQDQKDINCQFQDQRQRLNQSIRLIQSDLSFYKQICQKFLSLSDISVLRSLSTNDQEKREVIIPPFLMHDEKLNLPKSLKKNQVEDLWNDKRKGLKLQILDESLPSIKSYSFENPGNFKQDDMMGMPIAQNKRILKTINYEDEKYKEKNYSLQLNRQIFYRKTNFRINRNGNSQNKRPPSPSPATNKILSKAKLQPIAQQSLNEKLDLREQKLLPSGPSNREKLMPIVRK